MAKAEKLPSGKWRCIAYIGKDKQGKRIRKSFTAPSKKEAEEMAKRCELREKRSAQYEDANMLVLDAIDRYIIKKSADVEKGKISPQTVIGYKSYRENLLADIAKVPVRKLTDTLINDWIYALEEDHSAKTIKNAYSLLRASMIEVLPRSTVIDWRIDLPALSKKKVHVPTESDLRTLLQHLKVTDYDLYIACLLAAFGTMRRSEIGALTADDVHDDVISIDKAMVQDLDGKWIIKGTKTEMSTRDVIMPDFVINALPKDGPLVKIDPKTISNRFYKVLRRLDIETFRFHDLRHYSASIMHALGASNEIIMHRGGWSNDRALNDHYRGNMSEYDSAFTKKLNKHFSRKFVV